MVLDLDEVVDAWRRAPHDPATTIALCENLGPGSPPDLLTEVGESAAGLHASRASVLVAVGRMYLGASRLGEAQVILVAAGRIAQQSGEVFRWLGETLLRRGDAERAAKALARAIHLGVDDRATQTWHDRAQGYRDLQKTSGDRAVASAVQTALGTGAEPFGRNVTSETVGQDGALPGGVFPDASAGPTVDFSQYVDDDAEDEVTRIASPRKQPPEAGASEETARALADDANPDDAAGGVEGPPRPQLNRPLASPPSKAVSALPSSTPSTTARKSLPAPQKTKSPPPPRLAKRASSSSPLRPAAPAAPKSRQPPSPPSPPSSPPAVRKPATDRTAPPTPAKASTPPPAPRATSKPPPPPSVRKKPSSQESEDGASAAAFLPPPRPPAESLNLDVEWDAESRGDPAPDGTTDASHSSSASSASSASASAPSVVLGSPPSERRRLPLEKTLRLAPAHGPISIGSPAPAPRPLELLNALTATGVRDASSARAAQWETVPRTRGGTLVPLFILTVLVLGALAGALQYRSAERSRLSKENLALQNEIEGLLSAGQLSPLIERKFSHGFEIDPGSPSLCRLWLRDRAVRSLEASGDGAAIESAIDLARRSGLPEAQTAFARIASYLASHDLASALAQVARWESVADKDAYFQLFAGAALDRSGDSRSIERYQLALKLAPDLVPARLLLARALLLAGEVARGMDLVREFRSKWPSRPEAGALAALGWIRAPNRETLPREAELSRHQRDELPATLVAIPGMFDAVDALQKHKGAEAEKALTSALPLANIPALSSLIGSIALELGYDGLAGQAALRAVAACPLYLPGKLLLARVALMGGRYEEAQRLLSDADPKDPGVALVRAIVAYERMDELALQATLPDDASLRPEFLPVRQILEVLRGSLERVDPGKVASPDNPWGGILAIDAALDSGDLKTARQLLEANADARPPRALRWARWFRYSNRAPEADGPSKLAAETLGTRRAVVERTLVLLANDRIEEGRTFVNKHAAVLGPMAPWVLSYVNADGPHANEARTRIASLELPGPETPLGFRTLAILALTDTDDRTRAISLIRSVVRFTPRNPDILFASRSL